MLSLSVYMYVHFLIYIKYFLVANVNKNVFLCVTDLFIMLFLDFVYFLKCIRKKLC